MTDDTLGTPDAEAPGSSTEPALVARRAMLRKAAVGAAAVGAVWTAPRIEGLSVIPDASAATGPAGTFTGGPITLKFTRIAGPLGDSTGHDWWAGSPAPFFGWNPAVATRTAPLVPVGPGPAASGSVNATLPAATFADSSANLPFTINFPGVAPLTRLCGATWTATGRAVLAGPFPIAPGTIQPVAPVPVASPITFTLPQATNDAPPAYVSVGQWQDVTLTFNFC